MKRRTTALALAIFGLNVVLSWPLIRAEYLDDLQSNEGMFMSIGRFLVENWAHAGWFSWFNGGTPLESAYFPLVPALVAGIVAVTRCSPAHALHLLAGLSYSLGPVFLFLFARKLTGRVAPALVAALAWSLVSLSAMVPAIREEMGTAWGPWRLRTIVYWGETPHNVALSLLPLAWLLLARYWERPDWRRFALAVVVVAGILVSNAFGLTVVVLSSALLALALHGWDWRRLAATGGVLLAAYLLICRFLPISLLRAVAASAPTLGGDYRINGAKSVVVALMGLALAGLWLATRGASRSLLRFAVLFTAGFGTVAVLWYSKQIGLVPSAHRYILEAECGGSLVLGLALGPLLRRRPAQIAALLTVAAMFVSDYRFSRRWTHTLDITQTAPYREARWIGTHLPDRRVMVSGESEFWFNLFAENPQLSAGHEAAANWVARVAVYTIYSGQNAGDRDGPISVLWLKAFGCGAITVPGPDSRDHYHPVRNPRKFDGLLPLVWREGGDSIYQVPLRSTSLAHVVPADTVVATRPIHGLDVGELSRYVAALDDPQLPLAAVTWQNPEDGRIVARLAPGQVVSVQVTHDAGWRAMSGGTPVAVASDGLGMLVLKPNCAGDCVIELEFYGGPERQVSAGVGILAAIAIAWGLFVPGAGHWYGRTRKTLENIRTSG